MSRLAIVTAGLSLALLGQAFVGASAVAGVTPNPPQSRGLDNPSDVQPSWVSQPGYAFNGQVLLPEREDTDGNLRFEISGDLTMPNWPYGGRRGIYALVPGATSWSDRPRSTVSWSPPYVGGAISQYELTNAQGTYFVTGSFGWPACEPFKLVAALVGPTSDPFPVDSEVLFESDGVPCVVGRATVTRSSQSSVSQGESVVLEVVTLRDWSDGLRTEDPVQGYCELQSRVVGSSTWSTVDRGNCRVATNPVSAGDFRFLVNGEPTTATFVEVEAPPAQDVDAPRVESLTGPAQADPGSTVTFQWRLADESGVSSASVVLRNAAGQLTRVCDGGSGRLISGNASDGWYEQVCSLPQSMSAGDYTASVRAADVAGNSATSGSFTLRVNSAVGSGDEIVVTGPFWLGKTYADSKAVKAGTRVRISADVEAMWSDGQRHPAPGVKAYVQVMPSWSDEWHGFEHTVSFDMGILEAWTEVEETGRYRFMLEDGTASTPVEISVISAAPDQVSVKWPSRVVGKFKAKVVLKEAGKVWRKREKVVLEVKASGSDSWRVVARASTKRGKATLTTRQLALGTWRVRVPAHDLEDARVYGTA